MKEGRRKETERCRRRRKRPVTVTKASEAKAHRHNFRRLPPPSPPPSCLPHNSISCKNVLRYSWTSSAAQSNVSLRQSFSAPPPKKNHGCCCSPSREGRREFSSGTSHPLTTAVLFHTHTHTQSSPLAKPKQLLSIKVWICH